MTTGSTSSNAIVEYIDGWPLHRSTYRNWSGADQPSSPPVKTKYYAPVVQPAVIRQRTVKKRVPIIRTRLYNRSSKKDRLVRESKPLFKTVRIRESYVKYPERVVLKRHFPVLPKRARKFDAHAYSLNTKEVREDWFSVIRNGSGRYTGICGEQLGQGSDFIWSSSDDYALLAKLQDRVYGSTFHLGNFLGESPKTLSMISSIATRVAASLRHVRSGRIPAAIQVLQGGRPTKKSLRASSKDPASAYLEYTYGIVPLLKDAYEGAQALGYSFAVPRSHRTVVTRNAGGKSFRTVEKQIWGFTPASSLRCLVEIVESRRIICNQREIDLTAMSGLTDPASVAWEITPYSLIADWFLPIGNYLQALNVVRSLDAEFIVTHRQRSRAWVPFMVNTNSSDVFVLDRRPSNWVSTSFSLTRTVNNTYSVPRPSIKPLSKALSFTHCVNSIALLVSRFGSR